MENLNNLNEALDWDSTIETDGEEIEVLEPGTHEFEVVNFERARFLGSAKLPECNKAIITVVVPTKKGKARVRFDLILCKSLEWKISAFFRCIGQKKHGQPLKPNWNTVIGSKGEADFINKTYTNKYGEEVTINDISNFHDKVNFLEDEGIDTSDLPF